MWTDTIPDTWHGCKERLKTKKVSVYWRFRDCADTLQVNSLLMPVSLHDNWPEVLGERVDHEGQLACGCRCKDRKLLARNNSPTQLLVLIHTEKMGSLILLLLYYQCVLHTVTDILVLLLCRLAMFLHNWVSAFVTNIIEGYPIHFWHWRIYVFTLWQRIGSAPPPSGEGLSI